VSDTFHPATFSEVPPEAQERLKDVFEAFDRLERDLRQHLQKLRVARWQGVATSLGLLSAGRNGGPQRRNTKPDRVF